MERHRFTDPRDSRNTLAEWMGTWVADHKASDTTRDSHDGHLRHILPALGEVELGKFNRRRIESLVPRLGEEMSGKSAEAVMKVLSLVLDEAMAEGWLARNPARTSSGTLRIPSG